MKILPSFALLLCFTVSLLGQSGASLDSFNESPSRFRGVIEKYAADYGSLDRFNTATLSANRAARFERFFTDWLSFLERQDFAALNHDEQIDFLLFRNHLTRERVQLARRRQQFEEIKPLMPFADAISELEDARRRGEPVNARDAAFKLTEIAEKIKSTRASIESGATAKPKRTSANRAVTALATLRSTLRNWFNFYNLYDPQFTWWNKEPYAALDTALGSYQNFVAERLVGIRADDKVTIIGDPIGRDALLEELAFEMIPYTPDELIDLANKEFAWCENEMRKASREMGFGDDWKKALEAVKNKYVEPGRQPELIRDQALEAIKYLEDNDLVTIPPVARESWRMEMMSPARQLVAPFFLGGETILVSYPTDGMTHEQKLMSLRGNNPHFTHAVTHHELIPGHHLQRFMMQRHRPYRQQFSTPFWVEGWALYWEFLLWDRGFNKTPEDRVGALFWRMHRCARIIFSLSFHLEKMTPQECVDFLVDRVGHERDNALGEVRRSFGGDYGPLYQIAYMLGGQQFYALHRDLVGGRKMTDKQFHDAILRENSLPVELVRAILTKQKLSKDFKTNWRFYR